MISPNGRIAEWFPIAATGGVTFPPGQHVLNGFWFVIVVLYGIYVLFASWQIL